MMMMEEGEGEEEEEAMAYDPDNELDENFVPAHNSEIPLNEELG